MFSLEQLAAQIKRLEHELRMERQYVLHAHHHNAGGLDPVLSTDHGNLAGLTDDDHTQYAQIAAAETITGVWQLSTGGAIKGGSDASAPVGEVVAQVKTTTGAPSHSATEGTICWNSVDNKFYVNNNGTTGWTEIGAGGGSPHTLLDGSTHSDTLADTVTLGDVIYGNVTPAWASLAGNTTSTKKFLTQTGTGAVSAAPGWNTILAADVPDLSATYATAAKGVTNGDSHDHAGGDGAQVDHGGLAGLGDDDHTLARIGASTYSTVQHLQDIFHSTGWTSGGTINDAGSGNITADAGTGLIRATDSGVAQLKYFDWSALGSTAIPSDTVRYVGIEYNAGSPQAVVRTTYNWDFRTDFPLGTVINEGGTLHIVNAPHAVGDHAGFMIRREYETMPLERDMRTGGLVLGDKAGGNRYVTVSAGALWERLQRFTIAEIDTDPGGGGDSFTTYYRKVGDSGWNATASVTTWPNTAYDDNSGSLATLTANWYCNLWFYLELDGNLIMLYGQSQSASVAAIEAEAPPSSVPDRVAQSGRLIGRMIIRKSASSATQVDTVWATTFSPSQSSDHGALSGLSDDDHTQYLLASGTRGLSAAWDAGSWQIRAETFQSDVATGTAPLTVASTTLVTNLNADQLDSQSGAYYLDSANFTGTNWTDLTDGGATTLHSHAGSVVTSIQDGDADTKIQVEESVDEDIIRFDADGTEYVTLAAAGFKLYSSLDLTMYSDAGTTKVLEIDGATGHMRMASDGTPSSTIALIIPKSWPDPGGGRQVIAVTSETSMTAGAIGAVSAIQAGMSMSGAFTASGIHSALKGNWADAAGTGASVCTDFRSVFADASTIRVGTTLTNRYGLYVGDGGGSGSITNQYGVYIEDMAKGGTLNRALYSAGGLSVHAGAFRIGSVTAPTNTTAGDLTATRLIVPDAAILHSAVTQLGGPVVIPGDGALLFSDNANYIGLRAPATSPGTDFIYELPDDTPSAGQVLGVKSVAGSPVITTEWITAGSGAVATDTIWDAKGDLAVGTGANTAVAVTVGANDTILMADSAQAAGVKWVASGTPSTQAFGDAAAEGTTDGYTRTDHKHAMPANPVTAHEAAGDPHTGYRLESADHTHASTGLQGGVIYSPQTYVFPADAALDSNVATGDAQGGVYHHSYDNAETVKRIITEFETAPTGANATIQLEYGDTDDLDTVASWTEIDLITHTAGAKTIITTAAFTNSSIPANRLIRMNVDAVGSTVAGQNLTVHLQVLRPVVSS